MDWARTPFLTVAPPSAVPVVAHPRILVLQAVRVVQSGTLVLFEQLRSRGRQREKPPS